MTELTRTGVNKVKRLAVRQFIIIFGLILKILLPFILIITVVLLLFSLVLSFFNLVNQNIIAQERNELVNVIINPDLIPQDKFVSIGGIDYPMPRIPDLNEKDFYALMVLRVSEFGSRQDYELDGMEDSCSLYQQRVSELTIGRSLSNQTRNLLGEDKYNLIFTPNMSKWIQDNSWTVRRSGIPKTSTFGDRTPIYIPSLGVYTSDFHDGTDYGHQMNTPIVASNNGEVIDIKDDARNGKYITLKHIQEEGEYYSVYLHLETIQVENGQEVAQGQQIGLSGNTGLSTAPHLHYSIYNSWNPESGYGNFNRRAEALNPETNYIDTLEFIKQPFYGACRMLQYEQVQTGFFDRLQIERFKVRRPDYADFNLSLGNIDQFLEILVRSHAPREDTIPRWKADAKEFLLPAMIGNEYTKYKEVYNLEVA